MKRSDEIIEAVKTFFEKCECEIDPDTRVFFGEAFALGVAWADKNPSLESIWHKASEEPQHNNKQILSYSEDFDYFFIDFPNYLMVKDGGQDKDWGTAVLRNKISKWAYVADLLPKGGDV